MSLNNAVRSRFGRLALVIALAAPLAPAATFGRVVPIGGHASDIALDEGRGVLYIANFTASRIEVMSLADYTIARSITVAPYPGSLALSPDARYLVVTHYDGAGLMPGGKDSIEAIDLANNGRTTYSLDSSPLGVAFGADGRALILTVTQFLLLDPASGLTMALGAPEVVGTPLPVPLATFPPEIAMAELTATPDGQQIFGIANAAPDAAGGAAFFRFKYAAGRITAAELHTSAPQLGPRVLTVSRDGSYYMAGWALFGCSIDLQGHCPPGDPLISQWPNPTGNLNGGSAAVRSSKGLIYAQMPPGTSQTAIPPNLMILGAGSLTVVDRVQIPENLAGRSVFNSGESVLYSISDSGVTVFPMSDLDAAPRVVASAEDVSFRGNLCNNGAVTQQIQVRDPSGKATPFQICAAGSSCSVTGITISPSSGVTPAVVNITVDATLLASVTGTQAYQFEVRSLSAVNMPPPPSRGRSESYTPSVRSRFRLLLNNRAPEYRGSFFNAPGELVDLLADPFRPRFYVIRQDKNQVLAYDSSAPNASPTILRTFNTPTQLAITFDGKYLLVGHDDSQLAYRYDLDTLQPVQPISFPAGHYPKSIAVSGVETLSAVRVAGTPHVIDAIDMGTLTASPLPSLGAYKNDVPLATTLTSSPNGATILAAMPDGNLMAYSAKANPPFGSFTLSRHDFTALKGAFAVSNYGDFMVDHYLFNESLVQIAPVVAAADSSSGFAFLDRDGVFTAARPASAGYAQRLITAMVSQDANPQSLPTGIVEPPLLGDADYPFTRTLAPLSDNSALVALTTSGFTLLPWNYDAALTPPIINAVVNAADFTKPVAPGGLISLFGSGLGPMALVDMNMPLQLADSCLTVNGMVIPVLYISPTQVNAQLPLRVDGSASVVLHAAGGVSDALNISILPAAPAIFLSGTAGPTTGIALVIRAVNHGLVTVSNPVHADDRLTIYLTGMGLTSPQVESGAPAPSDPPASLVVQPEVRLGGVALPVTFAGLTPGWAGVDQIDVIVPFRGVPAGFNIPLTITQGGFSTSALVRVVD